MPRPDCPRCGSPLVVAAAPATPSESVLELRSGTARADENGGARQRLCSACGHQWDAPDEPVREAAEPAAPAAVGLRASREQRGRTLTEVSVGTGIQERHLRALEGGASIDEFPAPAYARFYLREYAEYLRLDPGPLLREFDARHTPVEAAPLRPPPVPPRNPRTGWGLLAVLSAVALALIAVLPMALRSDEREPAPLLASATPSPTAQNSSRATVSTTAPREPTGILAVLRLVQPSWVRAVADGEIVEASTLDAGTVVRYRADELLELRLGNAGGVRLRVDGELVPTGSSGSVVDLGFRWQDGEVVPAEASAG
jgi:cytoskeletal protein RodZ